MLRVWDIQTSKLLRSIQVPANLKRTIDILPVVVYTDNWAGHDNLTGLLYGYNTHLSFSPLACTL